MSLRAISQMAWQSKSKTSPFGRSDIVFAEHNSAQAGMTIVVGNDKEMLKE